ncbi:MAG: TOBE domain-containing protein [Halarcobacter sp.]
MKTSARNELTGKITELKSGAVMAEVKVEVASNVLVSATITNESKELLGLEVGSEVSALIKAPAIIISKVKLKASARNIIEGSITEIKKGQVSSEVKLSVGDNQICAVVTNDAVEDLQLNISDTVFAIFKASSVILVA